jgi:hypothetical protein
VTQLNEVNDKLKKNNFNLEVKIHELEKQLKDFQEKG